MPSIRPSSDLRNNYSEISEFCHKYNEPVYITKNGQGDLVVELHKLLEEGIDAMKQKRSDHFVTQ